MRLFRRKPKFVYEIAECDQFQEAEIHDPYDLVKHLTDEDNRFRRDYISGSIVISKVKNDLNGRIYYAQRFDLPQEENFDWLAALSPFFVKKPQAFDLGESDSEKKEDTPFTLEDFEAASQTSSSEPTDATDVPTEEIINEATPEEPVDVVSDSAPEEKEEVIQITKKEFERLQAAIQEQTQETERLRKEVVKPDIQLQEQQPPVSAVPNTVGPSAMEELADSAIDSHEIVEVVPDILRTTKLELDHVLTEFVQKETQKIETDIQRLDRRDQIEGAVTSRLQEEEKAQLDQLNEQLAKEKDQSIKEEVLRHQKRLQEIDSLIDKQNREKTAEIQALFKEKTVRCIQEEYDQQTEQLSNILQGKMDELKLRQQTLNDGLKENFQEALEKFNHGHDLVIQEVERKKKGSPVELEELLLLKQA